jgi:hypothetical protein
MAIAGFNSASVTCKLEGWEKNDVSGVPLTAPIFSKISAGAFLAADVTYLNENVAFEIGYTVADQPFMVRFFFTKSDRKLAKVTMYASIRTGPDGGSLAVSHLRIRELLIKNYGEPTTRRTFNTDITGRDRTDLWTLSSTTITLWFKQPPPLRSQNDLLEIEYAALRTGEAGKL